MRYGSELMQDGPYLQVVLPDVLPPDWDALRRDVESAIDAAARRACPNCGGTGITEIPAIFAVSADSACS